MSAEDEAEKIARALRDISVNSNEDDGDEPPVVEDASPAAAAAAVALERSLESKRKLVTPNPEEAKALNVALRTQLSEGQGETMYEVGVGTGEPSGLSDEDMATSVAMLTRMAEQQNADCTLIRQRKEAAGSIAEYLIRTRPPEDDFIEVRIAVVGNVDAGKSTMLGVLTHGELDNGRGKCRLKLFRHQHEADTGRTSSVAHNILGFDSKGEVVNRPGHDGSLDWTQICSEAAKVLTFIDLAGHEKYLKTTVFGLTGHMPDFAMLMIGANQGVVGMTKEHLGLSLALNVPVFVVVTKIDMCPANVLEETMTLLQKILKSPGCRKIPMPVNTIDDVVVAASNFVSERVCPIFQVSNVTGQNLPLLRLFLNLLSPRLPSNADQPAEFQIDDTYTVPGIGTVVSGTLMSGTVRANDTLLLGPDATGAFMPVTIRSIQRKRLPCKEVRGGQTCSFALKRVQRRELRKGMVLVSPALHPQATWEFQGEVIVLHHPTTITVRYQAMVHVGCVRQTASIVGMEAEHIRTGDRTLCRFRFVKSPEFLRVGSRLVFREGRTKAIGTITALYPDAGPVPAKPASGGAAAAAAGGAGAAVAAPASGAAGAAAAGGAAAAAAPAVAVASAAGGAAAAGAVGGAAPAAGSAGPVAGQGSVGRRKHRRHDGAGRGAAKPS